MHFINHFHNRNHYIKDNAQKGFLKILLLLQKAILRLSDGAVYKENRKSPFAHKYEALPENDLHCCQWAFRFKFYSEEFHPLLLMWSNVLADEADLGTPVRGTPSANVHPLNQCAEWAHLSQLLPRLQNNFSQTFWGEILHLQPTPTSIDLLLLEIKSPLTT